MLSGKDAFRLLPALLAGLTGGCVGGPWGPHPPQQLPSLPPPGPDARPAAPTIPVPPPAAATAAPPLIPLAEASPPTPENRLRRLQELAARDYAAVDSYTCRLTRREQINGKTQAQEVIRLRFRKQPWGVHFVWLDGEGKGREAVYVKGQHEGKLHTLLAAGDVPLMAAGKRLALAPDSLLVRSASRHAITEAGVGCLVDRFTALVEAQEKGDRRPGTLTYLGPQKRAEFEGPLEGVEQTVPAGAEKELPRGGRRWWLFDPASRNLPVLIVTQDERGQEVEYYRHDLFFFHKLGDDDFNPDRLWGKR